MKRKRKNPHAAALGKLGGKARAAKLTPERIQEIGRLGGLAKARNRSSQNLVDGI
jgi:general stress protein YciG